MYFFPVERCFFSLYTPALSQKMNEQGTRDVPGRNRCLPKTAFASLGFSCGLLV